MRQKARICPNCSVAFYPVNPSTTCCSPRCYIISNSTPNDRGCWLWNLACDHAGYGEGKWNGEAIRAHCLAYETFTGPIEPHGIHVCHSCDTPRCANPRHLFLGSPWDNFIDAVAKERRVTKLTEDEVEKVRRGRRGVRATARDLNVSPALISRVRKGMRRQKPIASPQEIKKALTPPG